MNEIKQKLEAMSKCTDYADCEKLYKKALKKIKKLKKERAELLFENQKLKDVLYWNGIEYPKSEKRYSDAVVN